MGMRINFYFVIGIHDAVENDPRHSGEWPQDEHGSYHEVYLFPDIPHGLDFEGRKEAIDDDDPQYLDKLVMGDKMMGDLYYDGLFGFAADNVIGWIAERGSNGSKIYYAMTILDEQYLEPGYKVLPKRELRSHERRELRRCELNPDDEHYIRIKKALESNLLIEYHDYSYANIFLDKALLVLHRMGWTGITSEMLYPMLVWDWR